MPRKRPRDKRLEYFGLGNTRCPICLEMFTEEEVRTGKGVTLEHAPPKTLGGREVCLTCERCNSQASATSDQAVKRSKSPQQLRFDVNGTIRSARFWPDGIPPSRMPYGFGTSPAAKAAKRELSKQTIVAATGPIQFDRPTTIKEISVSQNKATPRYVELSYLRSAYLLVFSLLGKSGYVYTESEAVRPIRKQIMSPDAEAGPSLVRSYASKRSPRNLITLRNNERPFFWSVRFDDGVCVLLPHGGTEYHYRQIVELPEERKIQGWEWEWRRFGAVHVDRWSPIRQSRVGADGLFGREYVTVSDDGWEQRWIVVNEVGDAMLVGPRDRSSTGRPDRSSTQEREG